MISVLQRPIPCAHCGSPAVCLGAYEGASDPEGACDECCGHGNEDGWCLPVEDLEALRVPANLVASVPALPTVWHSVHNKGNTGEGWVRPGLPWDHHDYVNLLEEQTAYGVARMLDAWERAHDPCWNGPPEGLGVLRWPSWAVGIADDFMRYAPLLANRLWSVGLDHRIRRRLDMKVDFGTLAALEIRQGSWWLLNPDGDTVEFSSRKSSLSEHHTVLYIPELEGIRYPMKASKIIWKKVCHG